MISVPAYLNLCDGQITDHETRGGRSRRRAKIILVAYQKSRRRLLPCFLSFIRQIAGHLLREAAKSGDLSAMQVALEYGEGIGSISENGWTALLMSIVQNHFGAFEILLDRGADVNQATMSEGVTPLYAAAQMGHLNMVLSLLERGAMSKGGPCDVGLRYYCVVHGISKRISCHR